MSEQIDRVEVQQAKLFEIFTSIQADIANLRTTATALRTDTLAIKTSVDALIVDRNELKTAIEEIHTDRDELKTAVDELIVDTQANKAGLDIARTNLRTTLLGDPGLAQGTNTKRFKTANATPYRLNGIVYSKAATDDIAQPLTTTNGTQYVKELISLDAAGTFALTAGTPAASQGAAALPATPANQTPIGYIEVPNNFTPGTTDVTAGMLKPINQDYSVTAMTAAVSAMAGNVAAMTSTMGAMTATVSALSTTMGA